MATTLPITAGVAALFITAAAAAQTTYHVNGSCGDNAWTGLSPVCQAPSGPKRTISAATIIALDGDTVIVADGVYTGAGNKGISFNSRSFIVRSSGGPSACMIDCENSGGAFWFVADETPDAVVEGFTIVNGRGSGGAFFCHHDSSPTIRNCVITGCSSGSGGAIYADNTASPTLIDCVITGNSAGYGGAIFSSTSLGTGPRLINCRIDDNTATLDGGAFYFIGGAPVLINTAITRNSAGRDGGAAISVMSPPLFINCTFAGNTAQGIGGALVFRGSIAIPALHNCVLWGNSAPTGPEIALLNSQNRTGAILNVRASDVQGGQNAVHIEQGCTLQWDEGNIDLDPRFADPEDGDVRPLPHSPLIDAGDNALVPVGITTDLSGLPRFHDDPGTPDTGFGPPPIVDMGAFEFQETTCRADFDRDGFLTGLDFDAFVAAFEAGHPSSGFDNDGFITGLDFDAYVLAFEAGC